MKSILLLLISFVAFTSAVAQTWSESVKIVAPDRAPGDWFGIDVDVHGNSAISGAPYKSELGGDTVISPGSAYIFERDSLGTWQPAIKLLPVISIPNSDCFGVSVAIHGEYAFVGSSCNSEDENGQNIMINSGAVFIFKRNSNGNWTQIQKIVASDRSTGDSFGNSVAISGNRAVIGAFFKRIVTGFTEFAGAAYVFELDVDSNWVEVQKIVSSDLGNDDRFGGTVDIHQDFVIIGARHESEDTAGQNTLVKAGSAYIFERDSLGTWNEVQKIVASDRSFGDFYGTGVTISGNYAVVGSPSDDEDSSGMNPISASGSSYIYERSGDGRWNEVQKITAPVRDQGTGFGISVAIDHHMLIVGANGDHDTLLEVGGAGAAHIFEKNENGYWSQIQKLTTSDRTEGDEFGKRVGISGTISIGGAWKESEDEFAQYTMDESGSAYIFESGEPVTSIISPTACFSYTSPSGNHTWTISGEFTDTIPSSSGSDSIITIFLTIETVDVSVVASGPMLTANLEGAAYQWLDCEDSHSVIDGANSQSYTSNENGNYAVQISGNGCIDTSECYSIEILTSIEFEFNKSFTIYPNPTSGIIKIDMDRDFEIVLIVIRDMKGQKLKQQNFTGSLPMKIQFDGPNGLYLMQVLTSDGRASWHKIQKQ